MDYIHGNIEPVTIFSLCEIDQLIVLGLINIYSSCINGLMSRESCKEMKLKIISQHDLLKSRLVWNETLYRKFIKSVKNTSGKSCEMAKTLKSGDVLETLKLALEILDAFQTGNIYMQIFNKMFTDKDFKKNALTAAKDQIDALYEKYGNEIPYAKMIERFYSAASEDKITEIFKQLDPDRYIVMAENVPNKSDIDGKELTQRLIALYGGKIQNQEAIK